jgi:hypothetical protein
MASAHLIFAGTLWFVSGVGFAQSPPATTATGGRIFQDPAAAPTADASAKKTFNESRSNNTRTPGDTKAAASAADASTKKTFNESRSNALRTPGDAMAATPGANPSGNKSYYESRSNTANRWPGDATTTTPSPDASAKKSFFESRSNTVRQAEDNAKPGVGQAAVGVPGNSMLMNTAPK